MTSSTTRQRSSGRSSTVLALAASALVLLGSSASADIPAGYYASADDTNATTLRNSLNDIVTAGQSVVNFSNSSASYAALGRTDADHGDPTWVQLIYGDYRPDTPNDKMNDGDPATGGWNREHGFPQSFFDMDNPCVSDLHSLWASDADINGRRSNSGYLEVGSPTLIDVFGNRSTTSEFEPRDDKKGDVARAMFYMDVRYEGESGERDLVLSSNTGDLGTGNDTMAVLSDLLQWHNDDPPDAWEVLRNHRVYDEQGNANPFIDHPEWVNIIYGSAAPSVADSDTISVSQTDIAPTDANSGDVNIPLFSIALTLGANEYDLGSIDLSNVGTTADVEIADVTLWLDRDNSDTVTLNDMIVGSTTFSGGTATLDAYAPLRLAPGTTNLLLTFSLTGFATDGNSVQVEIDANSYTHDDRGGIDTDPTTATLASGAVLVNSGVGGPTGDINIVMVSTRGTGGATQEYIVLANAGDTAVDLTSWELRSRAGGATSTTALVISGSIPARGHYIVHSYPTSNVEGVTGDLQVGSILGGMGDTTGRCISLFDATNTEIDGFSFGGGATNPDVHGEAPFFTGTVSSASTEVYARKRPGGTGGPYTDTDDNANDLEIRTGKTPPIDATVPVELSAFTLD